MRATYIIETEEWDVTGLDRDRSTVRASAAMSELFAIGLSAFKTGNGETWPTMCWISSSGKRISAKKTTPHGRPVKVMKNQLSALKLFVEERIAEGVALLRETTALEDAIPFTAGPVFPVKPSHELLGEVLLSLGNRDEARREFALALKRTPNRALSLAGLQ